ncbi:MAG: acetylornithine deacetylase [Roseinatronobacter sp.]
MTHASLPLAGAGSLPGHPRLPDTCAILADLVAFPSISATGNRAVTEYLAQRLGDLGARLWTMQDASGTQMNLFATLGPERPGGVILSGHTDVVPVAGQDWQSDPFTLRRAGSRLYGRGTCDMKGFVAACVAMAPVFAARNLAVPVHFAFTHDEEIGCFGAQSLTRELQSRGVSAAAAIIGEPTGMQPVDGHKGCNEYSVHVTGRAGHGSAPDLGVNAVEIAAQLALELMRLAQALKSRAPPDSPFHPPWTTLNIGALQGGQAHNVIPSSARLDWEMRPVAHEDADFIKSALARSIAEVLPALRARAPEAQITTQIIAEVPGLQRHDPNPARDLALHLSGANTAGLVPFGTEAGLFQAIGIPSVICGPGAIAQAHQPDEYLDSSQLSACLWFLDRLGARLETGGVT